MEPEIIHLHQEVFGNDLLRDIILGYVAISAGEVSMQYIRSCRLVRKEWLLSISRCLRKSGRALFTLKLTENNSVDGPRYIRRNGKLLNTFVTQMTGDSRIDETVPPFKIHATQQFFRAENYIDFARLLSLCGKSLFEMELNFPKDGGSMCYMFPYLHLPNLRKLAVRFRNETVIGSEISETAGYNNTYIKFVQKILFNSDMLTNLMLPHGFERLYTPVGVEDLQFPSKLKQLQLSWKSKNSGLPRLLLSNPTPELTRIHLNILQHPLCTDLITNLLENVRNTLVEFIVNQFFTIELSNLAHYFRLPQMEKLKVFSSNNSFLRLEDGQTILQEKLPAVSKMVLGIQTKSMIQKWTEESRFETVRDLKVSMTDDRISTGETVFEMSLGCELMKRIHSSFPNLQSLDCCFFDKEICGVEYLFRELKSLEHLAIRLAVQAEISGPDHWDSLLTGVPRNQLDSVRTNPALLEVFAESTEEYPSIRNMTELKTLRLENRFNPYSPIQRSLISDAVFILAFLCMPKLVELNIHGRFKTSKEMVSQWEATGRIIRTDAIKAENDDVLITQEIKRPRRH